MTETSCDGIFCKLLTYAQKKLKTEKFKIIAFLGKKPMKNKKNCMENLVITSIKKGLFKVSEYLALLW